VESLSSVDQKNFKKLKNAYDACMDEDTIKREGVAPLMEILDEITGIFPTKRVAFQRNLLKSKDTDQVADAILYLAKLGVPALIMPATGADDRDPDTVIVAVSSPWRIGLPAKDYYTDDSILKKYEDALVLVMAALYPDQKDAHDLAHGVVGFEKQLAAASPDADNMNDVTVSLLEMILVNVSRKLTACVRNIIIRCP
jgi:endothelin-converting enzyme